MNMNRAIFNIDYLDTLLEIIDWTRLDSIDPIENDKETRLETIKLIDFDHVS